MIQFNLLPDVKLEYIRSRRLKRTVIMVSFMVSAAALSVLIILFMGVVIFQKKHLNDLSSDITKKTNQLKQTPDLEKVLTVQSQLGSLSTLHDQKAITSRLTDYVTKVTPDKATINAATLDVKMTTLSITGSADTLSTVNTYVDTLKFTKYRIGNQESSTNAFKNVVLTNFSKQQNSVTYQIDLSYDPAIFSGQNEVTLEIPEGVTTRSTTEKPTSVFGGQ